MLHLHELVKQDQQTATVTVSERLPHFITAPCELQASYHVESKEDFYLIHLHVQAPLRLQCQRCLEEFDFSYENNTLLAVCRDDERAERLLEHYECVVSQNFQVSLHDLLIDELHLYAPEFHPEVKDCSNEINQFLTEKNESD